MLRQAIKILRTWWPSNSNRRELYDSATIAIIMTVIRSRTTIAAIMTLGLVRCRTCLPNKTEVVAIPSFMVEWHATTSLPIVNISCYLFRGEMYKVLLELIQLHDYSSWCMLVDRIETDCSLRTSNQVSYDNCSDDCIKWTVSKIMCTRIDFSDISLILRSTVLFI